MKYVLAVVVLLVVACSLVADYQWKRWIAQRKQERDFPANPEAQAPAPQDGDGRK